MKQKQTNQNYTIYLIKQAFTRYEDILKPDKYNRQISIRAGEIGGTLFLALLRLKQIPWLDVYRAFNDEVPRLYHGQASGVFLLRFNWEGEERIFALTHGSGYSWFRDGAIEESFGLITALNLLSPENLKALQTATLDTNVLLTSQKLGRAANRHGFRLDVFQDLLKSITGKTLSDDLPITLGGSDALHFVAPVSLDQIGEYLELFLVGFDRETIPDEFAWVNRMAPVTDKRLKKELDDEMMALVRARDTEQVYLAPPEITTPELCAGISYPRYEDQCHAELDLQDYLATFRPGAFNRLTVDRLRRERILTWSEGTADQVQRWSVYQCMHAEVTIGDQVYILHDRVWYRIERDFNTRLQQEIDAIPVLDLKMPPLVEPRKRKKDEKPRDIEGRYNEQTASDWQPGRVVCLDKKFIHVQGREKYEHCDLLHQDGMMIHVKRTASSQPISHLFHQGLVSGLAFFESAAARAKLQTVLQKIDAPEQFRIEDPSAGIHPPDHHIVFAIAQSKEGPLRLPFFARMALRNAYRRLHGDLGYRVGLTRIPVRLWGSQDEDRNGQATIHRVNESDDTPAGLAG